MTKEDYLQLQSDHHQSGLSQKSYLPVSVQDGYIINNWTFSGEKGRC